MQLDFHYYATYLAAFLAGYNHRESLDIAYSAQFVDECTRTFISKVKGPRSAATSQSQPELAKLPMDVFSVQNMTRIWASFHFLPGDLKAKKWGAMKPYLDKYRLICNPNGELIKDTVLLAKDSSLQAVGIAMHVLSDTWAHRYFAGTPAYVINNINHHFYEIIDDGKRQKATRARFKHLPGASDDIKRFTYVNTFRQSKEVTIMNLGHARAGHIPDYSYARYRYMPAWNDYETIIKDNPSEYYQAFCQMIYAMRYLRGDYKEFETDTYDYDTVKPYSDDIREILTKRKRDVSKEWKSFAERLSGHPIPDFDRSIYEDEYINATKRTRDESFLARFFDASMLQKSMVTNRIFKSGNLLAGISVDYELGKKLGINEFVNLFKKLEGYK